MKKQIITCILLLQGIVCYASQCPELYNGTPIEVKNTVELCNSFYVSLYDKQNQRVIVVAEHLKPSKGSAQRDNEFHPDVRVGKHPSPSQYSDTGYDKGHMAPAGDASNATEMHETFLMTNMTPQKPTLNRESWRMLEEHTRTLLSHSKTDMYVVNIAVYGNNSKMNGIPVPTGYWKIVTVDGTTKYYYADNVDKGQVVEKQPVPIDKLLPRIWLESTITTH